MDNHQEEKLAENERMEQEEAEFSKMVFDVVVLFAIAIACLLIYAQWD